MDSNPKTPWSASVSRRYRRGAGVALAWLALLVSLACGAQSGPDEDEVAADPPGRVGRVSLLAGSATLTDMNSGQSQPAVVNWPITGEQNIATGPVSRVEVRIGSLALRLGGSTDVDFVQIDDETIEVVVQRGAVALHVRNRDTLGEIDLTTPRERIVLDDVGRYRLDVDRTPGLTSLTVTAGFARILTAGSAVSVAGGQRADVSGEPEPTFQILTPLADAFDDWVAPLDRRDDALRSGRYVSAETTGIESLDDYGQWRSAPEYGQIWFPATVQPGWVPYRFGRWIWVAPWGWTWVDEAPWGFAPFHYGRWVSLNGLWGWVPGAHVARPVYAPCLVGWHGGGPAGSGPMVGWFPLGPHDVYVPGHHASRRYVESVNLQSVRVSADTSGVDWQPHYAYQGNAGAVTWVHRDTVLQHRPVARALQLPPAHWNSAAITYQAPVAAPAPHSIGQGASGQARNPQPQTTPAQPAASAAPVARRPSSPSPPTIGGEPGRRGRPLEQPIARAVPAPVPLPPAAVPRPVAPAAGTAPTQAPAAAAPPAHAPAPEPGQQPPVGSPQHEGATGRAPAESARGRTITR